MRHHDEAIERFIARSIPDPEVLAIVISGSLARGEERADSDVDMYLIVTEERWRRGVEHNRLIYVENDAGYEGGYYDIKIATLEYLERAAERGDDPVRNSFAHTRIVFSRIDDLAERIAAISVVPDERWLSLAESFLAQVRIHGDYFLPSAEEHDNVVLLHHAAVHTAVSACRAVLALNHVPFQGPKYLGATIDALENTPAGFAGLITTLLSSPSAENGRAVIAALEGFRDWNLSFDDSLSTFVVDNELAWLTGQSTPEYS